MKSFFSLLGRKRFLAGVAAASLGVLSVWAAEDSKSGPPLKKPESFSYDAGGHRDPFLPLVVNGRPVGWTVKPGVETSQPVLYGILWDPGGQSLALINDGEYRAGDTIGTYQVKEIRKDAVVLENGGEPVVLTIVFDAPSSKLSPDTTKGGQGR